ncbi:MAG: hypothetical protein OXG38_12340 [Chloroflexi bacterium]|nr:hypothetical protein [Chloroflexota bacterium]
MVSVEPAFSDEGDEIRFRVTLSEASDGAVRVRWETRNAVNPVLKRAHMGYGWDYEQGPPARP